MKDVKLSLVVPCYNEEQNVSAFYDTAKAVFSECDYSDKVEMIFINDGSRDNTFSELKKLYAKDPSVKVINFSRNFGKEAAMYAGLEKAEGEYVTIIDADLQQRPEFVLKMVKFLDENSEYDSVAMYQKDRNEGKILSFFKKSFYKIINAMCEIDFRSGASDFRTLRRGVVEAVLEMKEYFRFSKGIFSWVGFNTYFMPYVAEERRAGQTSWSFIKLLKYAIEGITAFTTFPLKISSFVGGICALFSLVYMLVVIIQKIFFSIAVPGYATLVVLLLFIGGIQLLVLGILGEYLAKVYIQGKNRPIYLVKDYLAGDVGETK